MRIGIISEEVSIYPPFGGIATANEGLSVGLRSLGHVVDLIYVPERPLKSRDIAAEKTNRTLVMELPEAAHLEQRATARSYAAYRRIKETNYDLLIWPDYRGLGYYSMLAKENGIAFANCRQIVLSYGPLAWCRESSSSLHFRPVYAEIDHLERESYRLADHVVFNSRFLADWCREKAYATQEQCVIPSLVPAHFRENGELKTGEDFASAGENRPVRELAFFGRLESRKGFELFVEALRLLQRRRDVKGLKCYLFGRPIKNHGIHAYIHVINRLVESPYQVFLIDNANTEEFLQFCRQRDVLAVMPSINDNLPGTVLECVNHQIPLLASNSGGIPEIVAESFHDRVLCEPTPRALCDRIKQALEHGQPISRPANLPEEILKRWQDFLDELAQTAVSLPVSETAVTVNASSSGIADVTVGVVHFNRPKLLRRALLSILEQELLPKRVIVVDNHSADQHQLQTTVAPLQLLAQDRGVEFDFRYQPQHTPEGTCRNQILAAAETRYLQFLDDVDVSFPEMLSRLYACAIRQHAQVVVQQQCYLAEDDLQLTPYEKVRTNCKPPQWYYRGSDIHNGLFANVFGPSASLFETDALRAVGGFADQSRDGHEVYEILFKLAMANRRFVVWAEPLSAHRSSVHVSTNAPSSDLQFLQTFKMLKANLPHAAQTFNEELLFEYLFANQHSTETSKRAPQLHPAIRKIRSDRPIGDVTNQLRLAMRRNHRFRFGKHELYRASYLGRYLGMAADVLNTVSIRKRL